MKVDRLGDERLGAPISGLCVGPLMVCSLACGHTRSVWDALMPESGRVTCPEGCGLRSVTAVAPDPSWPDRHKAAMASLLASLLGRADG